MMSYDLDKTLTELHGLFNSDRTRMIARCEEILADDPAFMPAVMMMGLAAYASGDEGLAINFLEQAHQTQPDCKEYVDLLAAILPRAGRVSDSLYYGKLSVALEPNPILAPFVPRELSSYRAALDQVRVSAHAMVAEMALRAGQHNEALRHSDEELRINPENSDALILSARALLGLGRAKAAVNTLRAAAYVTPLSGWLHGWLAMALINSGDHAAAVPHLRLSITLSPKDMDMASLISGLTEWLDDGDWMATNDLRSHLIQLIQAGRGTKTPDTMVITKMFGLLSDQYFDSSLAGFLLPVIKSMGDTVLYRINQRHDTVTQAFHHAALRVRECAEVDVFTLGRTFLGDMVSQLFLLGIPTHESKYVHFKGKGGSARIQWLSDPLVERLPTAEIILADQETVDLDLRAFGEDGVVLLDHLAAYEFPASPAPDENVGPLPRTQTGSVTFGVWGDLRRIAAQTIALWSQCILSVQGASLLIGGRGSWEEGELQHLHDRFAEYGIGSRVRIHTQTDPLESSLAFLHDVDVFLDSSPVSGGSEVARTLWMGVPVITLKGNRRAGRFGASILRAADCPGWIALTPQDYIAKAKEIALSSDLESVREGLRAKILASPLGDPETLSKALTAAVLSKVANGVPGR